MFPGVARSIVRELIVEEGLSMESAIDILLSRKLRPMQELKSILKEQPEIFFTSHNEVQLVMARSCIVNKAIYKAAL